ncbi:UmuC domain [Sesbania bispinosa]|nr:UmuC domain [Sesbania bispinosa]
MAQQENYKRVAPHPPELQKAKKQVVLGDVTNFGITKKKTEITHKCNQSSTPSSIYSHLHALEMEANRRPLANYTETVQSEVSKEMRKILVDWMVEVAEDYKLVSDTIYLAVSCIDRFLSTRPISRDHLQLLGVSCMFIASKYIEITPPPAEDFCYMTDNAYTLSEARNNTITITIPLNCFSNSVSITLTNLTIPTATGCQNFYQRCKARLPDYKCIKFLPSVAAASALFLSRFIIEPDKHPWNLELQCQTGYKPCDLKECVLAIHAEHSNITDSPLQGVREKYLHHKKKVKKSREMEVPYEGPIGNDYRCVERGHEEWWNQQDQHHDHPITRETIACSLQFLPLRLNAFIRRRSCWILFPRSESTMSLDSFRSGNSSSAPNSKRGFSFSNSASSNRSNDNSNSGNNKKKKTTMTTATNQKTLGVAWGSNSLSSSSRKSTFSDFGSYMTVKNRKLHDQFDAEASTSLFSRSSSGKPIFNGVSIFVDGFTVPSSQELRGYMLKYGGRFENYFSRHRVTHIICSNLPDNKVKNLRAFSAGLPVVKPTWILDSVAANRLLSWVPYQLDQLASNQPKLSAFFSLKSSKMSEDAFTNALSQAESVSDIEDSSMRVNQSEDRHSSKVGEMVELSREIRIDSDDIAPENTNAIMMEETASVRVKCDKEELQGGSNAATKDKRNVQGEVEPNHQEPSISVSSPCSDDQNVRELPSSAATQPAKQCHSTLADPNFVENYFKVVKFKEVCIFILLELTATLYRNMEKSSLFMLTWIVFFVSVVIRNHPELFDKPVAVCHSSNSKGTAEISSANYPARSYGIKAGIFVRDAKALCPHLIIFPYNFEAYEEVADQFYSILHRSCNKVQAVSCDEAFLDVTHSDVKDPELLASSIREEIYKTTGCTASAGIAGNMLMARIATRTAKPNGQYHITPERVEDHLCQLPINALPGVGHVLQEKLKKRNIHTCGQLQMISKASLQKDYGMKTGDMLWNYSRGIDNRLVGVFQDNVIYTSAGKFRYQLSVLADVKEIRGIGLQVSRLENAESSKQGAEKYTLKSWVTSGSTSMEKQKYPMGHDKQNMDGISSPECRDSQGSSVQIDKKIQNNQASSDPNTTPPPLCHLDVEVIQNLPPEVFSELNEIYGGKLVDYIAKGKGTSESSCSLQNSFLEQEAIDKEEELLYLEPIPRKEPLSETEAMQHEVEGGEAVQGSGCEPPFKVTHNSSFEKNDLLPSSLSQVDGSVLRQLPEDLKAVIVQQLPAHRKQEICSNVAVVPPSEDHQVSFSLKASENPGSSDHVLNVSLWAGIPPKWVETFTASSCLILKKLAEMYYKSGLTSTLSSLLHQIISEFHQLNLVHHISDETVNIMCELLKQYIKLKIGSDIEEIYICFRLLKRFAAKSPFFLQVYNTVFPYLQLRLDMDRVGHGEMEGLQLRLSEGRRSINFLTSGDIHFSVQLDVTCGQPLGVNAKSETPWKCPNHGEGKKFDPNPKSS